MKQRNEATIAERVPQFTLTTQRILAKFVWGVTFKGSKVDERCDWQCIPTPSQDVHDSTIFDAPCPLFPVHTHWVA
jgi:hypothetical protein